MFHVFLSFRVICNFEASFCITANKWGMKIRSPTLKDNATIVIFGLNPILELCFCMFRPMVSAALRLDWVDGGFCRTSI